MKKVGEFVGRASKLERRVPLWIVEEEELAPAEREKDGTVFQLRATGLRSLAEIVNAAAECGLVDACAMARKCGGGRWAAYASIMLRVKEPKKFVGLLAERLGGGQFRCQPDAVDEVIERKKSGAKGGG